MIVLKWAQLKYPIMAGLAVAVVYDYAFRFYAPPPEAHWEFIWLNQILINNMF